MAYSYRLSKIVTCSSSAEVTKKWSLGAHPSPIEGGQYGVGAGRSQLRTLGPRSVFQNALFFLLTCIRTHLQVAGSPYREDPSPCNVFKTSDATCGWHPHYVFPLSICTRPRTEQLQVLGFQHLDYVAAAVQSVGEPSTGLVFLDRYSIIALGDLTRVRETTKE